MVGTLSKSAFFVLVGGALLMALALACTREVVREVPTEVVVEKVVTETVEVPGQTVVVEKEVVKEVTVPGQTVVVEKEVVKEVMVPGETVVVEKEVVKEVMVPGETVVVEKEVVKEVEVIREVEVMAQPEGYVHRALEPFPKQGGVLRTSWGFILPHFDYHQGPSGQNWAGTLVNMYDGLVRRNPNDGMASVIPSLARSWDIAPDAMSYTFNLEDNVNFHDGSHFTSEDVKATFDRIIDPPDHIAITITDIFGTVESIDPLDDYTVRFNLKQPSAWQFGAFALPAPTIYAKRTLEEYNSDLRTISMSDTPGTGPFKFGEFIEGEYLHLEANPDYWNEELPYLDGIRHLHVPNGTDRAIAVITGITDFSWNVSVDGYNEALSRSDIVETVQVPNTGGAHAFFNMSKAPLDDVRVRRAMFLSLNRHDMGAVNQGNFQLARWFPSSAEGVTPRAVNESLPGYRADNSEDVAEAQRLLAEAGYPNGEGFPELEMVSQGGVADEAFIDMMKRNLNIDIRLNAVERGLVPGHLEGDFEIVRYLVWINHLRNPTPYLKTMYVTGASQNWGGYSNPELDSLVDMMDGELNAADLGVQVKQVQELLDNDPPGVLYDFGNHRMVWGNHVKGMPFRIRIQAIWDRLDTVWLDQ